MNNLVQQMHCGYLLLNQQGHILEANDYFTDLLNYEQEEISGKSIDRFLSSASKIIFHSFVLIQIFTAGRLEEIYLTLKTKDKTDIPVQLNGRIMMRGDDQCIECVFVQITKRSNYEKELQSVRNELEDAYQLKNHALAEENRLRKLFETILFSIHEGMIVTDNKGRITIMNKLAEEYTGWSSAEAIEKSFEEVFHVIDLQSREKRDSFVGNKEIAQSGYEEIRSVILVSKNGKERYIEGTSTYIMQDDQAAGAVTTFRDITKEYMQESVIDSFLNINMDILCVYDIEMNVHKVNRQFLEILGYQEDEIIGKSFTAYIHEDDISLTTEAVEKIKTYLEVQEFISRIRCKDGSYKYFEWRIQLSMGEYIFASARDVTSKTLENESLMNKAMRDQLTGLYNRHYLDHMIHDEMKKSDLGGFKISMAIIDLDRFKLVNDTWGHPVGDDLLKVTAQIAAKHIRKGDLLIRFGGEEFVVILPQTTLGEAVVALEKVREAFEMNNHPVTGKQTMSIGVTEKKENEIFQEWYQRADEALYSAKSEGRNRIVTR